MLFLFKINLFEKLAKLHRVYPSLISAKISHLSLYNREKCWPEVKESVFVLHL